MDKQERLSKLKEAQEKISNEIEELANEIENEKPKYWKPVDGERIWTWLYMFNEPAQTIYSDDNNTHKNKYAVGELFPTKELCIEHHKEKVYKERWKRLSIESGEDKNPWDGNHKHWYVSYNVRSESLVRTAFSLTKDNNVYFSSYEDVKDAIKEVGKDNVKRYILGIKE